jgi:hypothetical protein
MNINLQYTKPLHTSVKYKYTIMHKYKNRYVQINELSVKHRHFTAIVT